MRVTRCSILGVAVISAILAISPAFAADENPEQLLNEARKISSRLLEMVRGEVGRELEHTGPIRAITVCKFSAPELSSTLSRQTGMRVTRVSLRPRNRALGEPDAWEQKNLLDFEKRIAKGEKAESLEISQIVAEPAGRYYRYMKAIPMGQPCLACHGPASAISEGVKTQLANEYPHDTAVDFQLGQVRGAISVKKSLNSKP